ncbi:MAG: hypothetical protein HOM58_06655 [Rhodospirillaceae bacterium]|jgi:hypothetical protein|nr:hypothetical protein [Rhodospirillaceae bacterium]
MIIAPDGYERLPILVNPLVPTDRNSGVVRPPDPTVEELTEIHRLDLDSRLYLASERPQHEAGRNPPSGEHRQATGMMYPDLLAGAAASSESVVILAAGNYVPPSASQVAAAYENVNPMATGQLNYYGAWLLNSFPRLQTLVI